MDAFDLAQMKHFTEKDCYLGTTRVIEWAAFNARTMFAVDALRTALGSAIYIIRGPHPNRPEAIDACCPGRSMAEVFMQLCRLQGVSWGVYSGGSFHVDAREFEHVPARWFAVHSDESDRVQAVGLPVAYTAPIPGTAKQWHYFAWDHPKAFDGLAVCLALSERVRKDGREL